MTSASLTMSVTPTVGALGDAECVEAADGTEWAAWVNLRVNLAEAFCVDSDGAAKIIAVQDSSAVDMTACP